MTRATKIKKARHKAALPRPQPRLPRGLFLLAIAGVVGVVTAGVLFWGSSSGGDGQEVFTGVPATDPGPIHVHGLGINPSDGSLFIATHTGLFRVGKDSRKAVRIADRFQDTMGFSVVGPDRFLGSGHPDAREELPPLLGLIESTDAGDSWEPISLLGDADFHVLRAKGKYVYGYDASNDRLLRSSDAGRSWKPFSKPGKRIDTTAQVVDFALDPKNPRKLVITVAGGLDQGMYASLNGGTTWKRLNYAVGLLAWPTPERLYLVDGQGAVTFSSNGGVKLSERGQIGGQPAALLGQGADELYAALHDGTIKQSTDGGSTWEVRSTP